MSGFRQHPMMRMALHRMPRAALCFALGVCLFGSVDAAFAQYSTGQPQVGTGAPSAPPVDPPTERPLASGSGMLSIGQWLLSPTLDVYTLYNTNIQSSPTIDLKSSGFHYHPALQAELDTGIYDTKLYGNIDSILYPTQNELNTFNRQAGVYETYAPLRDLILTAHVDYTHNTLANVVITSIPTPITSPATPAPEGAAGVIATQQTVVNPNDNYTATVGAYKEFDRAFLRLGSTIVLTQYENASTSSSSSSTSPNYYKEIYNGGGGFWFSPILYAFADAIDTNTIPTVGLVSNSYLARSGIGSAQIGLFQGSVYYGQQGTAVDQGGGTAGGDIYGGTVSYFPTSAWNMSLSVDRLRNRSDIIGNTPGAGGLPGLALSASNVTTASSTQITTIAYKSDYTLSQQTSAHVVVSDSRIAFIDMPRVDNSWLASAGIRHQVRDNLSLTLDYNYTRYISDQPLTSFNRSLVTAGAHYKF
jgi:Putative beta-barrel porin 2